MPTIDQLLKQAYTNWDDNKVLAQTGRELHDRNRLPQAEEVLARALELNPQDVEAWSYQAYSLLRSSQGDKGLAVLRRGIETTDADLLRASLLAFCSDEEEEKQLRSKLEQSDQPVAKAGLIYGQAWTGDEAVLAELKRINQKHPEDKEVRTMLLWSLMGARNSEKIAGLDLKKEGVPLTDSMIKDNPDAVSGHWMKVQMLMIEKDWDAVLEATEQALERFPDEETLTYLRGRAFQEKQDLEHAVQCYNRAIGMKPSFAGARAALGEAYEKQDKLELAEEVLLEIGRANPDYPASPVSLALFLGRRDRWDEAESLFLEAWPKLPPWFRGGLLKNPKAATMLERPAVKQAVAEADPS